MSRQKRKIICDTLPNKRSKQNTVKIEEDWVSASRTFNYVTGDPFLDWCSMYKEKEGKGIEADSNSDNLSSRLMEQGNNFEKQIIEEMEEYFGEEIINIGASFYNYKDEQLQIRTIKAIKDGIPIIYSGLLTDEKTKTYGVPDLIVRTDFLKEICPYTKVSKKDQDQRNGFKYVIVDIKFKTLDILSDGIHLSSGKTFPAYKSQLYIYTRALNNYQKNKTHKAYLIGRGFKCGCDKTMGWNVKMALIDYKNKDSKYVQITDEAVKWYRDLIVNGKDWDKLSNRMLQMYPNMCNSRDNSWRSYIKDVAEELKDITLLWNCGPKHRLLAREQNIYRYDDPKLKPEVMGIYPNSKIYQPLNNIIKVNKLKNYKNIIMSKKLNLPTGDNSLYIDVESRNNILDSLKEDGLPTMVYKVGLSFREGDEIIHRDFTVNDYSEEEEIRIFTELLDYIDNFHPGKVYLYHYGHHDRTMFDSAITLNSELINKWLSLEHRVKWINLHRVLIDGSFAIKGALNYSLKSLTKAFKDKGYIDLHYEDDIIGDGLNSLIYAAKSLEESREKSIPIKLTPSMKLIDAYNKLDCQILLQIVEYLRTC